MHETHPGIDGAAPQTIGVGTSGAVYAGFWLRFVAWILDVFLSSASAIPVALLGAIPYLFFANEAENDPNQIMQGISAAYTAVYAFAVISASWFYFIVFECSKLQATPGKLALGLRVTDERGQRITFLRSVARTASKILSGATLMVGYILAGVTPRKQALHDLISGCLVVHAPQQAAQFVPSYMVADRTTADPAHGNSPSPTSLDTTQTTASAPSTEITQAARPHGQSEHAREETAGEDNAQIDGDHSTPEASDHSIQLSDSANLEPLPASGNQDAEKRSAEPEDEHSS